ACRPRPAPRSRERRDVALRHPGASAYVGTSSVSHLDKRFALRFISGKYQGGEFPLNEGQEVVVGRSSELDMVLVEELVSRRHASILLARGEITIEDLGSTNGTFVNGERVQKATLKEGDRVLIGTSILKLVPQTPDAEGKQARPSMLGKVTEKQVGKA